MYIIQIQANENGSRPALQSWSGKIAPEGYALCSKEFAQIFYSTSPAGFVKIEVEDGAVAEIEVNQEAIDAYLASLPEPTEPEYEPTQLDIIEAQVTYTAMMTDTLLEA